MSLFLAALFFTGQLHGNEKSSLPQVLIIGDSIYQGATAEAVPALKGRVQVTFAGNPGYHSGLALENFDRLLQGKKWDLIHFNFGMNDLMHRDPATQSIRAMHRDVGGVRVSSPEEYEENLEELATRLKATGSKIIWAATTPIVGNNGILEEGSEVEYNVIAKKVMAKHDIPVNDMHAHGKKIHAGMSRGHGKTFSYKGGVPLHTQMTRVILKELGLGGKVKGPVKVFILVGGSKTTGHGMLKGWNGPSPEGGAGTLDSLVLNRETKSQYSHLIDENGNWAIRSDIWLRKDGKFIQTGPHGVRYAGDRRQNKIGYEYSMGLELGKHFEEQIYIYKPAFGVPSLVKDLASPSSGKTGRNYKSLIGKVKSALKSLEQTFPDYEADLGYQLSGVILDLGENDSDVQKYEGCLSSLILDLRDEFEDEALPMVILGSGRGGRGKEKFLEVLKVQQEIPEKPEFKGNVVFVETRDFWPEPALSPGKSEAEWYGNAESYYKMGESISKNLIRLLK